MSFEDMRLILDDLSTAEVTKLPPVAHIRRRAMLRFSVKLLATLTVLGLSLPAVAGLANDLLGQSEVAGYERSHCLALEYDVAGFIERSVTKAEASELIGEIEDWPGVSQVRFRSAHSIDVELPRDADVPLSPFLGIYTEDLSRNARIAGRLEQLDGIDTVLVQDPEQAQVRCHF